MAVSMPAGSAAGSLARSETGPHKSACAPPALPTPDPHHHPPHSHTHTHTSPAPAPDCRYAIDGCATFFKRDRFALVKKYEVRPYCCRPPLLRRVPLMLCGVPLMP